ncbi:MAG: RHS repeat-associated core domain-containing protein [Thermoanaerobaculia bacterium]
MSRNEIGAPPTPGSTYANVTETYTYQDRGGRAKKRITSVSGTTGTVIPESWVTSQTTNPLGLLDTLDYPTCTSGTGCAGGPGPISTTMGYEDGMLRTVTAGASSPLVSEITYHASGMPAVVSHGPTGNQSLIETVSQAANGMPRPSSIAITSRDGSTFTTGTYTYDAAGNIKSMGNATIGTDRFRYDRYHRLVEAQMATVGAGIVQTATFDAYGNITAMNTNGTGVNFPASGTTNRLTSASYDEAGNTLSWNGNAYSWDRFNRMTRWSNGSETWSYVYTAGDERLWAIKGAPSAGYSSWTLRGFDNAVLVRDQRQPATAATSSPEVVLSTCPAGTPSTRLFCDNFESGTFGPWDAVVAGHEAQRKTTRYAYRDGRLLLSLDSDSGFHDFGLDHLGSVRVSTDDVFGSIAARHTYFPFGQEATSTAQDDEVMKFTGHERDLQSTPGDTADDLDYMHARFRSPLTGRFLSTDPVLGTPRSPQSWNQYAYVLGNPLRLIDPTGMDGLEFMDYIRAVGAASAQSADKLGYMIAKPMLMMGSGILNDDPRQFAAGFLLNASRAVGFSALSGPVAAGALANGVIGGTAAAATTSGDGPEAFLTGFTLGAASPGISGGPVVAAGKAAVASATAQVALNGNVNNERVASAAVAGAIGSAVVQSAANAGRSLSPLARTLAQRYYGIALTVAPEAVNSSSRKPCNGGAAEGSKCQ